MPIFEYTCKSCGKNFEKLVLKATDETFPCPECGSISTEKKLSVFSGIVAGSTKGACPSATACESSGRPSCCGSSGCGCPMH